MTDKKSSNAVYGMHIELYGKYITRCAHQIKVSLYITYIWKTWANPDKIHLVDKLYLGWNETTIQDSKPSNILNVERLSSLFPSSPVIHP